VPAQGEPIVGRSADPRRTAEARIRSRGVNSFEVHDQAPRTAIAELADISGNHADAIAAIDLCVVPTLTFERLSSMSEKFISTQPVALLSAPQVPECAQELV
jgi:hypothetical protein